MKVLLIQVDGKMPNLALMKISTHHKRKGDKVALIKMSGANLGLIPFEPEYVYISCIFSENRGYVNRLRELFKKKGLQGLQSGGCGLTGNLSLPPFIEHQPPDYDLYNIDYSMGFTSRGCIRKCPWCQVPIKEGMIRDHASIGEFWIPSHDKLILLDNNFLASPKYKENMNFILEHQIKVNFNQGLDIRLINKENASFLSMIDFRTRTFKSKNLHFAFDDLRYEDQIRKGINILEKQGIKPHKLVFYILCGFNTTHKEDMYRFNVLDDLGCYPFIMKYNHRQDDEWLNHFARWVNRWIYHSCAWIDYDYGNSQEIIKKMEDAY